MTHPLVAGGDVEYCPACSAPLAPGLQNYWRWPKSRHLPNYEPLSPQEPGRRPDLRTAGPLALRALATILHAAAVLALAAFAVLTLLSIWVLSPALPWELLVAGIALAAGWAALETKC